MGQAFFSFKSWNGMFVHLRILLWKRHPSGPDSDECRLIDTFVAILAGLIMFPAAFAVGIQPDAGPSLVFITLPNVFQQAFGGVPVLAGSVRLLSIFCWHWLP